jgi:hypothetical protein
MIIFAAYLLFALIVVALIAEQWREVRRRSNSPGNSPPLRLP